LTLILIKLKLNPLGHSEKIVDMISWIIFTSEVTS